MNILIAPNAFKGSLTAAEAARAMALGVRRAAPRAALDLMPISDGGDGLMEVLLQRKGGRRVFRRVIGPLGRPRRACYALLSDRKTAVIEMAQASGIAGLASRRLDPLGATSYGTGELIRDALEHGVRRVVVGMGGSATSDGGGGMAAALGVRFLDKNGRKLPPGAGPLGRLGRVDLSGLDPRVKAADILAVSDVTNPLLGPFGSARVYGPQKGATPAMVRVIERSLARYALIIKRDVGRDVSKNPGAGAAGGLGTGLCAFLGARIVAGAPWVLDHLGADARIGAADIVLTGEGRLDRQSFFGKGAIVLAHRARRRRVPVFLLCGQILPEALKTLKTIPGVLCESLMREGENAGAAMRQTRRRLRVSTERLLLKGLGRGGDP
ncbi:MAG: glycerate kinase [Elusimicrobia bacterium]|nr:glycerate kinase [Elusimicrobiota bacterium]